MAITLDRVERFIAEADRKNYNAVSTPHWLGSNKARIREVLLVAFGPEGHSEYRCYVIAVFDEESEEPGGRRTLEAAHRYLMTFPAAPFDPDQLNQML